MDTFIPLKKQIDIWGNKLSPCSLAEPYTLRAIPLWCLSLIMKQGPGDSRPGDLSWFTLALRLEMVKTASLNPKVKVPYCGKWDFKTFFFFYLVIKDEGIKTHWEMHTALVQTLCLLMSYQDFYEVLMSQLYRHRPQHSHVCENTCRADEKHSGWNLPGADQSEKTELWEGGGP